MKSAEWAVRAELDLLQLIRWYGRHDPDVATRISRAIRERADWLCVAPRTGSPLTGSQRKMIVAGTRHLIVYRPRSDGIYVLRIYHERQDWRRS